MDRAARDLLSRHTSNRACFAQRERDKPRLALNNITAGVREREDANRTREAGHLDENPGFGWPVCWNVRMFSDRFDQREAALEEN